jgi:hypothetical protein
MTAKSSVVRSIPFLNVVREDLGVVAGIEQDSLAAILNEGGKPPVLLHGRGLAERIVKDGDLGLVRLRMRRRYTHYDPETAQQQDRCFHKL